MTFPDFLAGVREEIERGPLMLDWRSDESEPKKTAIRFATRIALMTAKHCAEIVQNDSMSVAAKSHYAHVIETIAAELRGAGSGGRNPVTTDSQESPAAEHCPHPLQSGSAPNERR